MANNEMKLGKNKVEFLGVVKEQKLKEVKTENGESITGKLVLKCGEFKEVDVNVFVGKYNKDGKTVSKKYETLKDFIDGKLPTMASAKEDEEPTIVNIWGNEPFTANIEENMYKSKQSGNVVTNPQFRLGFANITVKQDVEEKDFKAEFDVDIYVDSITEEVDPSTNEETGRAIIKGYLPLYGGLVMPLELVAGMIKGDDEEDLNMAELVLDNVREGDTFSAYGDINFERIITQTKSSGKGFGRAKIETKTDYIHEFNILYGEIVEDEDKMFEEEDIKQALVQRDSKMDEIKNKEDEDKEDKSQKRGLGSSNSEGSARRQRRGF